MTGDPGGGILVTSCPPPGLSGLKERGAERGGQMWPLRSEYGGVLEGVPARMDLVAPGPDGKGGQGLPQERVGWPSPPHFTFPSPPGLYIRHPFYPGVACPLTATSSPT